MDQLKLIGKKLGMTLIFDDKGQAVPCSVIQFEPNYVVQVKTDEVDQYTAIQLGAVVKKEKRVKKPQKKHFENAKTPFCRFLNESRVNDPVAYQVGQEIKGDYFNEVQFVDVQAVSKGKGYQGVMKLHGFKGGPAAHGSGFHRHAGSTGMRSTPGRCLPGGKRASRMGGETKTIQNLKVIKLTDKGVMLVKGAIPGNRGSLVYVTPAKKKQQTKAA